MPLRIRPWGDGKTNRLCPDRPGSRLRSKDGCAILNGCDAASVLLEDVIPAGVRIVRYGAPARPHARPLHVAITSCRSGWDQTEIDLDVSAFVDGPPVRLALRAIGDLNAENAAAAWAAAVVAGVDPARAAAAISVAAPPLGRFEVIGHGPHIVVDFAHTPDALARTLAAARLLCKGTLWVVFGAGGHRDQGKRAPMGEAARAADRVIVTSDNPRDEEPAAIAAAILQGLAGAPGVETLLDREAAIRRAVSFAAPRDVVVIAGKGHEVVQQIRGAEVPFRDQVVALDALSRLTTQGHADASGRSRNGK